jgi:hypothetical protein
MKKLLNPLLLAFIAIFTLLATISHIILGDVSIFHGMILHTIFLLTGLSLLAYLIENRLPMFQNKSK